MHVDGKNRNSETGSGGLGDGPAQAIHGGVQGSHPSGGALLRREGLYSSHITSWQRLRSKGELSGLEPKKRGRKPTKRRDDVAVENERLKKRLARLEHELAHAKKVIHVQKKISELLGVEQPPLPDELKDGES